MGSNETAKRDYSQADRLLPPLEHGLGYSVEIEDEETTPAAAAVLKTLVIRPSGWQNCLILSEAIWSGPLPAARARTTV